MDDNAGALVAPRTVILETSLDCSRVQGHPSVSIIGPKPRQVCVVDCKSLYFSL